MLVLKSRRQAIGRIVFSPDGRGLAAAGHTAVLYWPNVVDASPPELFGNGGTWGVGFVAGGTHLVTSNGADGLWTRSVGGTGGHRFPSQGTGLPFACSPVERIVVV